MQQVMGRKARVISVNLRCRDDAVTLTLRHGQRADGFQPMGKNWRTLRRGDTVRGPKGYDYIVEKLTLQEAVPPLDKPVEIESVAAWVATGLRR